MEIPISKPAFLHALESCSQGLLFCGCSKEGQLRKSIIWHTATQILPYGSSSHSHTSPTSVALAGTAEKWC